MAWTIFWNLSVPCCKYNTVWLIDLHAANRSPPTRIKTGSRPSLAVQNSCASFCTSMGHVAENISICLSGLTWLNTRRTWSPKPMPNISSASSRTTYVTLLRFVHCSFSSWMNRPGVATTMSFFSRSFSLCSAHGTPPKTTALRIPVGPRKSCTTLLICKASSRVGHSTTPTGPSPARSSSCAMMCTNIGMTYARVLPEPVSAIPMRSRPCRAAGKTWTWIGVGALKCLVLMMVCSIQSGKAASLKVVMGFGIVSKPLNTSMSRSLLICSTSSAERALTTGCSL
mmetsp:Transcript_122320/g.351426  ORF Transcript_122320/g.351426 Transcript_122320/m.351426 type:complete len:284 (-) Transcript_122320:111-962(-)